jgi:hypothetical protein
MISSNVPTYSEKEVKTIHRIMFIKAHTLYPGGHPKNRTIPRIVTRHEYDDPMKILLILSIFKKPSC